MNEKILCYGEIVADLIEGRNGALVCKVGGAPLNVAVGLNRLGKKSVLLSAVGRDWFGRQVLAYLKSKRVTGIVSTVDDLPTRMTVVSHDRKGERSFEFSPGAAAENEIVPDERLLRNGYSVLYFGSFPFGRGDRLQTFQRFVGKAREAGIATMYDPNLRLGIFADEREARKVCRKLLRSADIVRLNAEELNFIDGKGYRGTRSEVIRRQAAKLLEEGPGMVFVTDGTRGSYACVKGESHFVGSFNVKSIDSTGCGDAFTAMIISEFLDKKLTAAGTGLALSLRRANAAGAIAATKLGGADSMPTRIEIERLLNSQLRGGGMAKKIVSSRGVGGFRTRIN